MDKPFRLERVDLSIKQQITALNKRIVSLCHEKQFQKVEPLIQSAKLHLKSIKNIELKSQLQSQILSTQALVFHNFQKQQQALSTMDEAISLQKGNIQNLARIFLKKCSILNDCKRYEEALVIAKKANQLLRGKKLKSPNRFERQNVRELYIMSLLSIGTQYQKMQRVEQAISAYQKGVQACRLWVGQRNQLTETMINSLNIVKRRSLQKRGKNKTCDRTTDKTSIRTNTQANNSISKEKNFRIKQVSTSKNSFEQRTRIRGSSIKEKERVVDLVNAYHPKLKSIDLRIKNILLTDIDEMKDIERIKGLYKPRKEKKILRHRTETKTDRIEDNEWDAFKSNQIFA